MNTTISDLIFQETKQLPDELLKEVLDFILFLKNKKYTSTANFNELSLLQENELTHLEDEFKNYKLLYPNE